MSLRTQMTADLIMIEADLGNPVFTWNGVNYGLIPSVSDFTRELDTGGFKLEKILTATVRKYDARNTLVFTGGAYPQPQQKILYNDGNTGITFRIESIKHSPEGAYIRMICASDTKGL